MLDLKFVEPASLAQTLDLLARYGDEARLVAGGTFVVLALKLGLFGAAALVSLRRLPELAEISTSPGQGGRIGATATHRAIETNSLIRAEYPLLAEACGQVGNVRVRHQGTLGGNLVTADYASDPAAVLVALDARLRLVSADGETVIPVRDFITGHYATVLRPDQLLADIRLPPLPPGSRGAYLKFKTRSSEDRPCANVAALADFDPAGRCRELRLVVGAAAERPQQVPGAEALARGERLTPALIEEIAGAYGRAIEPIDDLRGSAWYRRQVIPVLVRRALVRLAEAPPGERQ